MCPIRSSDDLPTSSEPSKKGESLSYESLCREQLKYLEHTVSALQGAISQLKATLYRIKLGEQPETSDTSETPDEATSRNIQTRNVSTGVNEEESE